MSSQSQSSRTLLSRAFQPFYLRNGRTLFESETLLWISASPSLKYFDLPLLQRLSQSHSVARWEYQQTWDEGSSLDEAVNLLVTYLKQSDRPLHLAGHGMSAIVAMLAADRIPEQVASLCLLGISPLPGLTWHAHYYLQRMSTPCSQVRVLARFCQSLFGLAMPHSQQTLITLLEQDLNASPSPHSIFHIAKLDPIQPKVPFLICHGALDFVISPTLVQSWQPLMKPGDRQISIPDGYHFCHYHFPEQVAHEMTQFWSQPLQHSPSAYSK